MSNKTSVNNSSNKHPYILECNKASETAIEWSSAKIVRTEKGMKNGIYPPPRVQIFIGDTCTWDSDLVDEAVNKYHKNVLTLNKFQL